MQHAPDNAGFDWVNPATTPAGPDGDYLAKTGDQIDVAASLLWSS